MMCSMRAVAIEVKPTRCRWPLEFVVALLCCHSVGANAAAADYLSDDYFPGLHVLEPQGSLLRVYKDSQKPEKGQPAIEVDVSSWKGMADARAALEKALDIPPPEPLQQPWGMFDAQGTRLDNIGELLKLDVAFITLIGQWMWPAVRVGFEQTADGVLGGQPLTLKTLSIRPVVIQVDGFILPMETDEIIKMGKSKDMFNSEGVLITADKQRNRAHNEYRTSTQAWLHRASSPVIAGLDDRTSNLTRVPKDHNEEVQLLRYDVGQFYHSHLDWSDLVLYTGQKDQWRYKFYGWRDRMATLFWYLNDVEDGGETVFPKHGDPICPGVQKSCKGTTYPSPKRCDVGLRVKPKRGSVILWYNFHPDGRGDQNTLHGGCPPAAGYEKWSGNKWISSQSLRLPMPAWMPDHPALKRHGWRDLEESKGQKAQKDSNACALRLRSEHPSKVSLLWVNPDTRDEQSVGDVEPGSSISMNSFNGHTFRVQAGGSKSKGFRCKGDQGNFVVAADLKVRRDKPEL